MKKIKQTDIVKEAGNWKILTNKSVYLMSRCDEASPIAGSFSSWNKDNAKPSIVVEKVK